MYEYILSIASLLAIVLALIVFVLNGYALTNQDWKIIFSPVGVLENLIDPKISRTTKVSYVKALIIKFNTDFASQSAAYALQSFSEQCVDAKLWESWAEPSRLSAARIAILNRDGAGALDPTNPPTGPKADLSTGFQLTGFHNLILGIPVIGMLYGFVFSFVNGLMNKDGASKYVWLIIVISMAITYLIIGYVAAKAFGKYLPGMKWVFSKFKANVGKTTWW